MNRKLRLRIPLDIHFIAFLVLCFYILFTYIARDSVNIPSSLISVSMRILMGLVVIILLSNGRELRKLWISRCFKWYLSFLLFSIVTMLYAPDISAAFDGLTKLITGLFLIACIVLTITDTKKFSFFAWTFSISSVGIILLLISTGNLTTSVTNRLGNEVYNNANEFAGYIMFACIYSIWLLIFDTDNRIFLKIILLAFIVLDYIALALSGGRGAFFVPVISLYIMLLLKSDKRGRKHIVLWTFIVFLLLYGGMKIVTTNEMLYNTIGFRIESFLNGVRFGSSYFDVSAAGRKQLRELAFNRFLYSPLWGYGFNSFRYLARSTFGTFFYSHCNYTEMLYTGGVFYFIAYYYYHIKYIISVIHRNNPEREKFKVFILSAILSILVYDYNIVSYNIPFVLIMLAMCERAYYLYSEE